MSSTEIFSSKEFILKQAFKFSVFFILFCASFSVIATPQFYKNKVDRAFDALDVYNYFEAKELFTKSVEKYPCISNYGLSLIYFRNDNPFHDYDSAYSRILSAIDEFDALSKRDSVKMAFYKLDSISLAQHKEKIESASFMKVLENPAVTPLQQYINYYSSASQIPVAVRMRDSLAFELANKEHTSRGYKEFMDSYPESHLFNEANIYFEKTLFQENTEENNIDSYITFISSYPNSPFIAECHRRIYEIYTGNGDDEDVYYSFIKNYPHSPMKDEAWQRIYDLYMLNYDDNAIEKFILKFPDYPFQEQLLVESKLAKEVYLPFVKDGKWGFINDIGQIVIEAKYDFVEFFQEGLAVVSRSGKSGAINKSGEEIIAPFFDEVENFHNSYAVVSEQDKYGLVNRNGRMIVPLSYSDMGDMNEGMAVVFTGEKCGYISRSGSEVIEPVYSSCSDFLSGKAICEFKGLFGVIDNIGNEVLPFNFAAIVPIDSNLVKVQLNKLWGIYNVSGARLTDCEYDEIGELGNNRIMVVKNNKVGFVNAEGSIVIPLTFDSYAGQLHKAYFINGLSVIQLRDKKGLIDTLGNLIIPNRYDDIIADSGNPIPVSRNGKWGYIDIATGKAIIPFKHRIAYTFRNGYAVIEDDEGYNLINKSGKKVYSDSFDDLSFVKNDKYIFELNGNIGMIDSKGVIVIPSEFEEYQFYNERYLHLTGKQLQCWYDLDDDRFIFNYPISGKVNNENTESKQ